MSSPHSSLKMLQNTDQGHYQFTLATYIVFAVSLVLSAGLGSIAGVVMAYMKRDEMRGSVYYNHMQFLIRTFWVTVIGGFIGGVTVFFGIGFIILAALGVWHVYRLVFGIIRLMERRPVDPKRWIET